MSELLILYRDAQRRYEKFIRYYATATGGALIYYDMLLDEYSKVDQIFVKRVLDLESENAALTARIAELEAENAGLRLIPQPLQHWTEEKKQIYEDSKIRSEKS